jgi:hypothetical protein
MLYGLNELAFMLTSLLFAISFVYRAAKGAYKKWYFENKF